MFERDDRLGGLLRYGIPEFKMEKKVLDRRLAQLREPRAPGSSPAARSASTCRWSDLRAQYDAVVLAVGALRGRDDATIPGRELSRRPPGDGAPGAGQQVRRGRRARRRSTRSGKHVVIIGGGDTGADCLRHRAPARAPLSVTQLDQYPSRRPPGTTSGRRGRPGRTSCAPTRRTRRRASAKFAVAVQRFVGDEDGHVRSVELQQVRVQKDPATGRREVIPVNDEVETLPADLVLLAIGFEGVEEMPLLDGLGLPADPPRHAVVRRRLADGDPGRLRLRRRPPRRVAGGLGDRRGPLGGQRGGRVPDGRLGPAGPGPPDGAAARGRLSLTVRKPPRRRRGGFGPLRRTVAVLCVHGQLLSSNCAGFATIHLCGRWASSSHEIPGRGGHRGPLPRVRPGRRPRPGRPKPFWTPDAMRAAVPMDTLVKAPRSRRRTSRAGRARSSGASPTAGVPGPAAARSPSTAGRVFFVFNGQKASCSG